MKLKIETGNDNKILRTKSVAVKKFDKKLKKFVEAMFDAMRENKGVGLAAPQVGLNERVVTLDFQLGQKIFRPMALINPEIISTSEETETDFEGCLSLPGEEGKVCRSARVVVRFCNEKGCPNTLELSGLNARAIQHEIDHLDGILFTDRVSGKIHTQK